MARWAGEEEVGGTIGGHRQVRFLENRGGGGLPDSHRVHALPEVRLRFGQRVHRARDSDHKTSVVGGQDQHRHHSLYCRTPRG